MKSHLTQDARAEPMPTRPSSPTPFAMFSGIGATFACPFCLTGINLYALTFTAAQMTVQEAECIAGRQRFGTN